MTDSTEALSSGTASLVQTLLSQMGASTGTTFDLETLLGESENQTATEDVAAVGGVGKGEAPSPPADSETESFDPLDTNEDGAVSAEERSAGMNTMFGNPLGSDTLGGMIQLLAG